MQRLLSDATRAALTERRRQARLAASDPPPSVGSGGELVRVTPRRAALWTRASTVGNPNDDSLLAGWAIVKGDTPSQMQANGTQARLYGFERHPVVYACVDRVTSLIAATPLEVYRKVTTPETLLKGGAGDVVSLPGHPAEKLLEAPYFSMSPYTMRQLFGVHWLLYGNWFAALIRQGETVTGEGTETAPFKTRLNPVSTGEPQMIRPIHPERLLYVYLDAVTEEPILYDWRDRYGYRHRTPAMDMLHARDSTATDWIFGYPRAAAALLDIQTDNEASTYVRQVVHNDGTAGTIIMLESLVSSDEARALKERYYQKNVERGERGRTDFMGGVKDVKQIGFTLKDLEFPDLRRVTREDICAAFGVDPRMVGVASATGNRSSLSGREALEARYRLIQETVLPIMRAWEAYLNVWLMPEYGDVYVRFNRIALAQLTQDETEVWTRTTAAVAAGLLSREEGRRNVGAPDKMDDTDTLYVPTTVQLMPVADQFAAHEANQALQAAQTNALLQGPNSGEESGRHPDEGEGSSGGKKNPKQAGTKADGAAVEPEPKKKKQNASGAEQADQVTTKSVDGVITSEPGSQSGAEVVQPLEQRKTALEAQHREMIRQAKDAKAVEHERAMHRRCIARFMAERDEVDRCFSSSRSVRAIRGAPIPDPSYNRVLRRISEFYAADAVNEWMDEMSDVIHDCLTDAALAIKNAVGGADWKISNPEVQQAIDNRAAKLARQVSQTTADQITATMHVAFQAGMSMAETASLVRSTVFGGDATDARASRIARTESIGALNEGEHIAAKLSGVVSTKEWLAVMDDRTRDSHAELDGTEVGLDEVFSNGCAFPGDQEGAPEEVINCRCTLLYHGDSVGAVDIEHDDSEAEA